MIDVTSTDRGLFSLPNEILLTIFNSYATPDLLGLASTCRHIHSIVLRLVQHRLQAAADLDGYSLFLECGPPAAKWTITKDFCQPLGTEGLAELAEDVQYLRERFGHIARMNQLYTRFRPVRQEQEHMTRGRPHPAGDIPGSRTWKTAGTSDVTPTSGNDPISRTISVDAQCLFSQLEAVAFLGKREVKHSLLFDIGTICDGTIRVWRDWLSRQCDRKQWSDGAPIIIHRDDHTNHGGSSRMRALESQASLPVSSDPSILWVNTRKEEVGIKFRVKERKWRRENPVLFASDVEVPVSYSVDFEEVVVRTTHLLLKLEEARKQMQNKSRNAIVIGPYITGPVSW